jgi:putative spermidine/putrescine transport system substrate-binding protein
LLAVLVTLTSMACGGSSSSQSTSSSGKFNSQFPAKTYSNLSGQVVFWDASGGPVIKAKQDTIFKNYTQLTGVKVASDFYCCDLSKIEAQEQSGRVLWDVLEVPSGPDFVVGSREGLFQKLDKSLVPLDRMESGNYTDYGYKVELYAVAVAWNTKAYPMSGKHPTRIEDVFDTASYPGKRCLMNFPDIGANLESALLADGVNKTSLYPLDVDRAFRKLDTIKSQVIWAKGGQQVVQNLISGECNIGLTWSARPYDAVLNQQAPVAEAFNDAVIYDSYFAIAKGAPNAKNAQALLAMWISDKQGQSDFVTKIPYPTPIKGLTDPNAYPESVRPFVPNIKTGITSDENWYTDNQAALTKKWDAWLAK